MEKKVLKNEKFPNKRLELTKEQYGAGIARDAEQWHCHMELFDEAVRSDAPVIDVNYVEVDTVDDAYPDISDRYTNVFTKYEKFTKEDFMQLMARVIDFLWNYEEKTLSEFKSLNEEVRLLPQMFYCSATFGMRIDFSKNLKYREVPELNDYKFEQFIPRNWAFAYTKCFEQIENWCLVTELESEKLENIKIKALLDAGDDCAKIEELLGESTVKGLREINKSKPQKLLLVRSDTDKNVCFNDIDGNIIYNLLGLLPTKPTYILRRTTGGLKFVVKEGNEWVLVAGDEEYKLSNEDTEA